MKTNQIVRFALGLVGLIILVWFAWQVKQVFVYFAVSVVLALMGRPVMSKITQIKIKGHAIPDWAGGLVVIATYLVLVALFFKFLIPVLAEQIDIIVNLDVELILQEFSGPIASLEKWFKDMNINGIDRDSIQDELVGYLNFTSVSTAFENVLSGLGTILVAFMSILFITFFLLKDKNIVNNIVDTLTPDKYLKSIHNVIAETKDLLTRYFIGVVIQVSIITTIVSIGLSIFNVPNALLIGFIAGLINIIPYIGPIIGATFGISLSLLSYVHMDIGMDLGPLILKILGVFAVAQLTDNFVLQPLIFSKSVKAHPLEIFVVIMAAGMIAGVVGMILAVPTYTFLRIVAKEFFQGYKVVQGLTKDL